MRNKPSARKVGVDKKRHSNNNHAESIIDDSSNRVQETWDLDFKIKNPYKLTERQSKFSKASLQTGTKMCIVDGPAGTAKTYIAALSALKLLNERKVENIIYIRSIVESASRSMGALPGEVEEKFAPWAMPLIDKLDEVLTGNTASNLLSKGYIKCVPVNFTRGLTFKNSCVIIDEAQNMTKSELTTILTRFGEGSTYFVVGDTFQADIGDKSGFADVFNAFDADVCIKEGIHAFQLDKEDIVRSEILRFIVERLTIEESVQA